MKTEHIAVTGSKIKASTNLIFSQAPPLTCFHAQMRQRWGNKEGTYSFSGGVPIGTDKMRVDGDLLIVPSYTGPMLSISKVNNDGSITNLYTHSASDKKLHNIAVDTTNSIVYAIRQDVFYVIDYSALKTGGDGDDVTENQYTPGQIGLPSPDLNAGVDFTNGMVLAGNYIYCAWQDATYVTGKLRRYDVVSQVSEDISIVNYNKKGFRGSAVYDSANDRVYLTWYENGEVTVVVNASNPTSHATAPPTPICIDMEGAGLGDDMRWGRVVLDPNDANTIIVAGYYRITEIDITDCLDTSDPQAPTIVEDTGPLNIHPYFLSEAFHTIDASYDAYDEPFIIFSSYNGRGEDYMWYDREEGCLVGILDHQDVYWSNEGVYHYYPAVPVLIETANSTKYWVWNSYNGNHGNQFLVYAESKPPGLEPTSSVTFGPFSFDDSSSIGYAKLMGMDEGFVIPTGCSTSFYASNDNGTSWQEITYDCEATFSANGTQVLFRIDMTGLGYTTPYYMSEEPLQAFLVKTGETSGNNTLVKKQFGRLCPYSVT